MRGETVKSRETGIRSDRSQIATSAPDTSRPSAAPVTDSDSVRETSTFQVPSGCSTAVQSVSPATSSSTASNRKAAEAEASPAGMVMVR